MGQNYIITNRTNLRFTSVKELEYIHKLHTLPEVTRFNTLDIPNSIKDTAKVMAPLIKANGKGEKYTFSVFSKENNTYIGLVGIVVGRPKYKSAEIWFKYFPEHWGKGYATEILKALIDFCFKELKLHRVGAGCAVANVGSIKVMEKAGMKREGHCRQTLPLATGWSDNYEYAILDIDVK